MSPDKIIYARCDTHYLIPIYLIIIQFIQENGLSNLKVPLILYEFSENDIDIVIGGEKFNLESKRNNFLKNIQNI